MRFLHPIARRLPLMILPRSPGYRTTTSRPICAVRTWGDYFIVVTVFVLSLLVNWIALAQKSGGAVSLDSYKCSDFLVDAEHPNDAARILRTTMMLSWATGYTAAHEANGPRADTRALQLVGVALGNICQEHKDELVTTAFATALQRTLDHPPPSAQSRPPSANGDNFVNYPHRDLPGNDLNIIRNTTVDACKDACVDAAECIGYSFDIWNKMCILKSGASSLTVSPKSVSAVRASQTQPSPSGSRIQIDRFRGKGFPDKNTRVSADTTLDGCERTCLGDEACMAYTFLKSPARCVLLDNPGEYFPNSSADSGVKVQRQ